MHHNSINYVHVSFHSLVRITSILVSDIPPAPRALIVAIVSLNSVEASWLPAQTIQAGSPEPVFHQVTLTDLGTGQVLRRNDVISSGIDGDTQQRQHYGDLMPGSYRVTVAAGNVFGLSRSLSQSFDIAGKYITLCMH